MNQYEKKVLDVALYDGENVLFFEERNVQRGRTIYSILAILCAVAGVFWFQTVIVPVVAIVIIVLCFYFRIKPSSDIPVGWVLTNTRFIQIYLDDQIHQPVIVDTVHLKEIDADRDEEIDSGGEIIVDIVMFPIKILLNSIRDAILDRHEKTTKAYWQKTRKIVFTYQDDTQIKTSCHNDYIAQNVGSILAKSLLSIENDSVQFPANRSISR